MGQHLFAAGCVVDRLLLSIGCVILLLGGCAAQDGVPDAMVPDYYAGHKEREHREMTGCVWIIDERSREEFYGYRLTSADALSWLKDGVEARLGRVAIPRDDVPDDDIYISIKRAYMSHVATSISGIVVLEVGNGVESETFRGRETRANWWGTDAEYSMLLSDALDEALKHVAAIDNGSLTCHAPDSPA